MDLNLLGKRALVFGAGSGLGKAAALSLAREGAHVVLAGRTHESLQQTAGEITAQGGNATPLCWDASDTNVISEKLHQAQDWLKGPVQILFNNGGGPPPTTAQGQPQDLWRKQFESMVIAVVAITDAVLPNMRQEKWGRIITNTSSGVIAPIPGLALSNALRNTLTGWSKTLAGEVGRDGVTVNIVIPGRIQTERITFLDSAKAKRDGKTAQEIKEQSEASIALGRYGRPQEYGDVVAFLASECASYITGSMIRVDGGGIPSL